MQEQNNVQDPNHDKNANNSTKPQNSNSHQDEKRKSPQLPDDHNDSDKDNNPQTPILSDNEDDNLLSFLFCDEDEDEDEDNDIEIKDESFLQSPNLSKKRKRSKMEEIDHNDLNKEYKKENEPETKYKIKDDKDNALSDSKDDEVLHKLNKMQMDENNNSNSPSVCSTDRVLCYYNYYTLRKHIYTNHMFLAKHT